MIGAAGVGLVIAIVAMVRHHRRREWARAFADARAGVSWVARTLLPQISLEPSTAQMLQDWQPASARVMTLENQLAQLQIRAPNTGLAAHVRSLRDAVVSARVRLNELLASPNAANARSGVASIAAALDAALAQTSPAAAPA